MEATLIEEVQDQFSDSRVCQTCGSLVSQLTGTWKHIFKRATCQQPVPGQHRIFKPGDRVKVYDYTLFKNDIRTPADSITLPAIVVQWYGYMSKDFGAYDSLIDVIFDHRPTFISHGHFTWATEHILDQNS